MTRPGHPGGMSFTEVMFAVIVLGIGFIMLAAMFPVAIQQTKLNNEDAQANAMARNGLQFMEEAGGLTDNQAIPKALMIATPDAAGNPQVVPICANPQLLPAPAAPFASSAPLWDRIKGNLVRADDPRFAFVPLYRRDANSSYAQVYLFVVQNRNNRQYNRPPQLSPLILPFEDLMRPAVAAPATLEARPVRAGLYANTATLAAGVVADTDLIVLHPPTNPATETDFRYVAGEGGFVVVGQSPGATGQVGRIYRLGNRRQDVEAALLPGLPNEMVWELAPGHQLKSPGSAVGGLVVYMVGRGLRDPNQAFDLVNNPYEGLVQDIGCYTSLVRVSP